MFLKKIIITAIAVSIGLSISTDIFSATFVKKDKKTGRNNEVVESKKTESAYEKLFKDRKYKSAKGVVTLHLTEDEKLIVEFPKKLVGKDMLIGASVESTSDGGDGAAGYIPNRQIHIRFIATDSLMLVSRVSPKRFITDTDNVRKAVSDNSIPAIIASFPIDAQSPDSTAYVFEMSDFFKTHHEEFDPVDAKSANSFGGILKKNLLYDKSSSMLTGIESFDDSFVISGIMTYNTSEVLVGMTSGEYNGRLTASVNFIVMLLSDKLMSPRYSDPRIGVNRTDFTRYSGKEQGSESIGYAMRWNMADKQNLVFYVDTLFPSEMAAAISNGILKWNSAFDAIGKKDFIVVKRYPSDRSFNANDPRNICVKYEIASSGTVRSSTWCDPRTGEILGANISVAYDALAEIHYQMMTEISIADHSVRTAEHRIPRVYEGLQAKITSETGHCLGLSDNLAASTAIPADSLRSPSFTARYGLSCSVMDEVPYNYMARSGDMEKGVRLVNTELGNYDRYAIKWLYCTIDGASDPDEEWPVLDKMIKDSYRDPLCLYVRNQPYAKFDPRTIVSDLGDDPVYSTKLALENMKETISTLDEWAVDIDPDLSIRPYINASSFMSVIGYYTRLARTVGGIYFNEAYEGDGLASYKMVPAQEQKDALKLMLSTFNDFSWLDGTDIYRDFFFIRSPAGYMSQMLLPLALQVVAVTDFTTSATGDYSYSAEDVFNDVCKEVLKYARSGRKPSENNIMMQYVLLGYTLQKSNVVMPEEQNAGAKYASSVSANDGWMKMLDKGISERMLSADPITSIPFQTNDMYAHKMYKKLLELKQIYEKAIRVAEDESARNHYRYFVMAIERALKID